MLSFTLGDWIIIGVILFSTLISIRRGFLKEVLSLVTWLVAVIVAWIFGAQVSTLLVDYITVASIRNVAAFGVLFFVTLLSLSFISLLLTKVIKMAGLSGADRLLGMLFGFARGMLVVVVIVLGLARLDVTEEAWWVNSILIPHIIVLGDWMYVFGTENLGESLDRARSIGAKFS